MNRLISPLRTGTRSRTISDLHAGLELLLGKKVITVRDVERKALEKGLRSERGRSAFGKTTRKLVALFQEQNQLPVTGEVDQPTADLLNERIAEVTAAGTDVADVLPDYQHLVRGQVRYEDGLPIPSPSDGCEPRTVCLT